MTSYSNSGYDVMNCFAKFEKFLPHSIITPSFRTVGDQMLELDKGLFAPSSYRLGCQNTPYILGLRFRQQMVTSLAADKIADFVDKLHQKIRESVITHKQVD